MFSAAAIYYHFKSRVSMGLSIDFIHIRSRTEKLYMSKDNSFSLIHFNVQCTVYILYTDSSILYNSMYTYTVNSTLYNTYYRIIVPSRWDENVEKTHLAQQSLKRCRVHRLSKRISQL